MTQQEFMRQIWRPYDTVTIEGGAIGKVTSICFPSRSVKVTINEAVHEWVECDLIVEHKCVCGNIEDTEIIADLHNKLMTANKRNNDLQYILDKQKEQIALLNQKVSAAGTNLLCKKVNLLTERLVEKKKIIASIEDAIEKINEFIEKKEIEETQDNL